MHHLRDYYNEQENKEFSDDCACVCMDESLTKQSQADDADINVLMERMKVGYEVPVDVRVPRFGDFTAVSDFETAMNAIRAAEESFMEMDWKTRARFNNDPQMFLEFCNDLDDDGNHRNYDDMLKLGLAVERKAVPEAKPMKVEVINPPPKPAGPVIP